MGYVGIIGNIHFTEIFDFLAGWLGFDPKKDDWATRIAERERAGKDAEDGKPTEPAEKPGEEPREAPPPKPAEELPPPKKPEKKTPPRSRDYDLRDIIP